MPNNFCNLAMQPLKKKFHYIWMKIDTCGHSAMVVGAATGLVWLFDPQWTENFDKNYKFAKKQHLRFVIFFTTSDLFINW